MDIFVVFGSYLLLAILLFGIFALFVRIFSIVFKK